MRVVLLHDAVGTGSSVDELDVLAQMEAIESALRALGHEAARVEFSLDLQGVARRLREVRPDVVFNLVESVGGQGRLVHLAPALLESMGIAFTGNSADATYLTANKAVAKRVLRGAGIATPEWFTREELERAAAVSPGRWIIKSVWEHASRGLDEGAVVEASSSQELLSALEARLDLLGGEGFIERYIEGREFNLSILTGEVLPPAEILFDGYTAGQPKIVGYRAKWDEGSFEYQHTPRRFDVAAGDEALIEQLRRLALECWRLFALNGYARVDFRIDEQGRPWVLEVNTNPCLSPDAGFAAALQRAAIPYSRAVELILSSPPLRGGTRSRSERATQLTFRTEPRPSDCEAVREIVASTGFFHDFEVDVAVELVQERLAQGIASEYFFIFADDPAGNPIAYACFGPIACTVGSFDLYWIAVHDSRRGRGLGRRVMAEVERQIAAGIPNPGKPAELIKGRRIYIETSSKPQYQPTREFYSRCGYREEARFADFYAPGDDKLVYVKAIG